jgi:hypothetical protein
MNDTPSIAPFSSPDTARSALGNLLQQALMLELSTIPPYATACYSIKEQGEYNRSSPQIVNAEPVEVIRQVMVEEMLHMVLVANVCNALAIVPVLNDPALLPRYPSRLLSGKGPMLRLRRFCPQQIAAFREVEKAPDAESYDRIMRGEYQTIGGFYIFLDAQLEQACEQFGEAALFSGDPARQISPADYYGAGGEVILVTGLSSAREALREIAEEGEGATIDGELGGIACDGDKIPGPTGEERLDIAHFFKFDEILHSRYYQPDDRLGTPPSGGDMIVDWSAVWPMADDLSKDIYEKDMELSALSDQFDRIYSQLLDGLNDAFNGSPERLGQIVPLMFRLKEAAQRLMRIPLCDGETAGPLWLYREREGD